MYNYRYSRGGNYYYTSQGASQDAINYGYEEFRRQPTERGWGYNPQFVYYQDASY